MIQPPESANDRMNARFFFLFFISALGACRPASRAPDPVATVTTKTEAIPGTDGVRTVMVGTNISLTPQAYPALYKKDGNLRELIVGAEFLTVRGKIKVPGGSVVGNCRRLTFADKDGASYIQPKPISLGRAAVA